MTCSTRAMNFYPHISLTSIPSANLRTGWAWLCSNFVRAPLTECCFIEHQHSKISISRLKFIELFGYPDQIRASEHAPDNTAPNLGPSSENSCVPHSFAKLPTILLELGRLFILKLTRGTTGALCVNGLRPICATLPWQRWPSFLINSLDITSWENAFKSCSFVAASPP